MYKAISVRSQTHSSSQGGFQASSIRNMYFYLHVKMHIHVVHTLSSYPLCFKLCTSLTVVLPHSYASVILFFFFTLYALCSKEKRCLCHFTDGCYSCLKGVAWLKTDIPCECITMLVFFYIVDVFSLCKLLLMDMAEMCRLGPCTVCA